MNTTIMMTMGMVKLTEMKKKTMEKKEQTKRRRKVERGVRDVKWRRR